jgi:hypothetical protein
VLLGPRKQGTTIAHIHPNPLNGRERLGQRFKEFPSAVPIRHIGRMNDRFQHQSPGINEQMPLATAQFLGAVIPARPPFSVVRML